MTEAKPTKGAWLWLDASPDPVHGYRYAGAHVFSSEAEAREFRCPGMGLNGPVVMMPLAHALAAPDLYAALEAALGFVVAAKIAGQSGKMANALPAPFALETEIRAALAKVRPC